MLCLFLHVSKFSFNKQTWCINQTLNHIFFEKKSSMFEINMLMLKNVTLELFYMCKKHIYKNILQYFLVKQTL